MLTTRRERGRNPAVLLAATLLMLGALIVALSVAPVRAEAAKKVTVTFNAAGGKIGKKATLKKKVVKGAKLGKLPKATRTGHSFKGWYTKKTGGKKATAKMRIRAKTVIWAQWKRVLSADEKQLVGEWSTRPNVSVDRTATWIKFRGDGTFSRNNALPVAITIDYQNFWLNEGLWRVQGNRIIATNLRESVEWHAANPSRGYLNRPIPDQVWEYRFDDKTRSGLFAGEGFTWLIINHYPHKGSYDDYGIDYVIPTLAG